MAKQTDQSSFQKLKQAIRERNLSRLYIFHGEEVFLLNYYLGQLKKLLVDELTESFNYHKLTKETFDIQSFADAVESLPMMAENTFIWVDEIDLFKLPEGDRTKLCELFSDIPEYCTVLFTYETTPWKPDKRQKKLWEAIEKNGTVVEFAKQDQRELINWVTRHFMAAGKRISPDLCAYLIDITGGTMTALAGEISKICAFSGAETIVKSDIDAVTEPVLDAVVFRMTDQMGSGQYGVALDTLQKLLKMQQEPIAILGVIGGHFRKLATARTLLDAGKNSSELMRLYGMRDFAARNMMASARQFKPAFCAHAAELIMETDYKMKTSFDAPERLLEMLIMELAMEARNG